MTLTDEEIIALIARYETESKALKQELLKMCWFMRGSITYEDAMLLSFTEREIIAKIIDDNIETTKKTGMPFY